MIHNNLSANEGMAASLHILKNYYGFNARSYSAVDLAIMQDALNTVIACKNNGIISGLLNKNILHGEGSNLG